MNKSKRLYKVDAEHTIVGYFGGNFVIAENREEAIEKCKERYKYYPIKEYTAKSLGEITGDIL